jgi:hypothetical protein
MTLFPEQDGFFEHRYTELLSDLGVVRIKRGGLFQMPNCSVEVLPLIRSENPEPKMAQDH